MSDNMAQQQLNAAAIKETGSKLKASEGINITDASLVFYNLRVQAQKRFYLPGSKPNGI